MDPLTIAAASGMRSRMESLTILANNLANATTSGYKSDKEFYGLYSSSEAENPSGAVSTLPVIERQWTDFAQGTLQATGNPLDVALAGRGFLAVNAPGGTQYTRNGSLQVSKSGELINADGYPLRGEDGLAIHVTADKPVDISSDGAVSQGGTAIGKLAIVDFKSSDSLQKIGGSAFQNMDPKNAPIAAANVQLQQGKLEASNVSVSESAMRLVGVMRQFEMLQKAVQLGVEMNAKAIQEVARVST